MKRHKKNAPPTAPPSPSDNIALSPRQLALQQLFRNVKFWGSIALVLALLIVLPLYGEQWLKMAVTAFRGGEKLRDPVLNTTAAPGPAPAGMVWIPGGEFYMGCEGFREATPVHLVYVDGFWMDKTEVTNEQFEQFIKATNYVTEAEKQPNQKDFPKVAADKLKPFSIVFKKPGPNDYVSLEEHTGWWDVSYGACWKHPEGPGSTIKGREKHPVVHISYNDALAYCKWAKKRLPTEAEWEFAARGGLDRKIFCWGDDLTPGGKWMANVWQGNFPYANTREDGFEGTAPVGSYPANGYGLHDMAGNVWEWCADWYRENYYEKSRVVGGRTENPKGPDNAFDPLEPATDKRVQRGGSFLCADNYCERYIVGTRGKGEVTSAQNHSGFRCVMDAK